MDDVSRTAAIATAFGVGGLAFVAAAIAALLARTKDVPVRRRASAMARVAALAAWNVLPPRRAVASVAAGLLAFVGSMIVGLAITFFVVWLIPLTVPHPTEAHEGFGDAMMTMFYLSTGAMLSLQVAVIVGLIVGERVGSRRGADATPETSPSGDR